jgi:hypothetical protein
MYAGQLRQPFLDIVGQLGGFLGPIPQMLLAIAMVMVLFENERNAVQENALAFSTLGIDPRRLLSGFRPRPQPADLCREVGGARCLRAAPSFLFPSNGAALCPRCKRAFRRSSWKSCKRPRLAITSPSLPTGGAAWSRSGGIADLEEPLPALSGGKFEACKQTLLAEGITDLMAVSLQTREHNFGVLLFPHAERRMFGSSNLRLLIGLALQIALTLENYVVMHEAQRRTKEYELLTEIGQAISSHLDQDDVLRTVQVELGQIFDTSTFYIAFQEEDEIRFELEIEGGVIFPKRSRKVGNGLTEHIIRTGEPLLIAADLEEVRSKLGVDFIPPRPARSLLRHADFPGRQTGGCNGGAEYGAGIGVPAQGSRGHANRRPSTGDSDRKCAPVCGRAAPRPPSRIS